MADYTNKASDLGSFFGGLGSGMSDGLYDSFMARINAGKRILMSDNPRSFEGKVQSFYDQHKSLTKSDFDRIKEQHYGPSKRPGPPQAPPPPKSASGPAPLVSPLSPGFLASMAAAAAAAPGYPTATPSPAPAPPPPPPRAAPPPPPPPSWPANMMGGGFPQPPPPPLPPSWPANMMPSPWPASMMGGRPSGSPWPANMGPPPAPYNINPGAGIFPQNMQPPGPPPPPKPAPSRFQTFKSTFGSAYARQAKYGIASVRGAGQAALTAAFPEAAIVKEALKTLKSLVTAMKDFSEQVLESNKRLGQYNGQIAIAYTRLSISDFYRNTNLANRTATSSVELVKAVNRMRDSFQEYRVLQGNLLNQLAIGSARYFGNLGEALSPFFAKFNEVLGRDPKAGGIQTLADILAFPLTKFLDDLKGVLKAVGVKFPDVKAGGPELGVWDRFAADVLRGNVGGPILPKAGPRPGIGGGAAINFGRGI